jgi:hypothetical protein
MKNIVYTLALLLLLSLNGYGVAKENSLSHIALVKDRWMGEVASLKEGVSHVVHE